MQRAVAYTSGMNPRQISIEIAIATRYLEDQSKPDDDRYVFSYTIRLRNVGDEPARLHARHWIITDAKGQTREVRGEGVVGEQPRLEPGQSFEYSSGAVLETECGTMHGSYEWVTDDGASVEGEIPRFTLSIPRTLH